MNIPATVGTLLRTWRERALLTQEELAQRTGLNVRTIRRLESDTSSQPRAASIRLLGQALDLSADELAALTGAVDHQPGAVDEDPAGQEPPEQVPVPRQLPATTRHLAGRDEALRRLEEFLPESGCGHGGGIVLITGGAGVGKTTLAVHWAQRVADRFPDGVLFLDLHGFDLAGEVVEPNSALRRLLEGLGVPAGRVPSDPEARSGLLRTLLASRRTLLVLDNVRDANQVRPLLPGLGASLALVTSRNQLAGLVTTLSAEAIRLEALTSEGARNLLASRLGIQRIEAEPHASDELVAGCAGLPLALALVASRAESRPTWSLEAFAAELKDSRTRLAALRSSDLSSDLTAVLSWSYRALEPEVARLFRLFGLHPAPDISVPAAASLAARDVAQTTRLLDQLTYANLVGESQPGRYALHDLVRLYASRLAEEEEPDAERRAAGRRLVEHYLHTAYAAVQHLGGTSTMQPMTLPPPSAGVSVVAMTSTDDALRWSRSERPSFVPVARYASALGLDRLTCHLVRLVARHVSDTSDEQYAAAWSIAAVAAARLGDLEALARADGGLARARTSLGDHPAAEFHVKRAVDAAEEFGDPVLLGHTLYTASSVAGSQGRHQEALEHDRRALELFRSADFPGGQAMVLNAMGWHCAHVGRCEERACALLRGHEPVHRARPT